MFIPLRRLIPNTADALELIPLTGADQSTPSASPASTSATREMGRCFAPP